MSFQVINSYHISRMYKLFLAPFFPRDFFFPCLFAEEKQLFFGGNYLWMFLLRYSQQMSPLPSHTRRRLQQLHQRCLPECKFLARTCLPVLALKSFWSCCRYVIVWVFFFSSYMLSLYLSGALIPGLSEERCLHRYSDAPAKHRRRFLENDLWPEFLLHCDVEWNRGDRWSMLFFPFQTKKSYRPGNKIFMNSALCASYFLKSEYKLNIY